MTTKTPVAASAPMADAEATMTSTAKTETFLSTPLETIHEAEKTARTFSLPGMGELNTAVLREVGMHSSRDVFFIYLGYLCNEEKFLRYIASIGVKFHGGKSSNGPFSAAEQKEWFIDALRTKAATIVKY